MGKEKPVCRKFITEILFTSLLLFLKLEMNLYATYIKILRTKLITKLITYNYRFNPPPITTHTNFQAVILF